VAEHRLRVLKEARTEALSAADQYEEKRPGLGVEFLAAAQEAIQTVASNPLRWPLVVGVYRRFVVQCRFPYAIYYRVDGSEVVIVAIAHQKRRPGYWLRRR